MKSIAIVGGGATGVVAALNLLEADLGQVTIFEPAEELGGGIAYSGSDDELLLNVPAERMGWSAHNPKDFQNWLSAERPEALKGAHYPYVPRHFFRRYLQSRLGGRARHIRQRVTGIQAARGGWEVGAGDKSDFFDAVIVATGYQRESEPSFTVPEKGDVVILGAGLTAIDHWRLLRSRGFKGIVHFISRRGLFPLTHGVSLTPPLIELRGLSPRRILAELRMSGGEWPALADHIRAIAPGIWRDWTARERASFVRHLKPYWEVTRHRVPESVFAELRSELNSGHAQLHRGRLENWDGSQVIFRTKNGEKTLSASALLHATGVHVNTVGLNIIGHRPTEFGYRERLAQNLFTAGPASRAEHWEITAIPEIRAQCSRIAGRIAVNDESIDIITRKPGQTAPR